MPTCRISQVRASLDPARRAAIYERPNIFFDKSGCVPLGLFGTETNEINPKHMEKKTALDREMQRRRASHAVAMAFQLDSRLDEAPMGS
jgi:hypothetical protein